MKIMKSSLLKNKLFLIFVLASLLTGSAVSALELDWPVSPAGSDLDDDADLTDFVKYFYEWGVALGAVAVFYSMVTGGFQYITSTGNPNKMNEAKNQIFSALSGFLLLLSSFIILNTINPDLTGLYIPEIPEAGEAFDPLTAPEQSVLKDCEKAVLYDSEGCSTENPTGETILTAGTPYKSTDPGFFKPQSACRFIDPLTDETGGLCVIYFYSDTGCANPVDGGTENVFLSVPTTNIESALGSSNFGAINCIKVGDI